MHTRPYNVMWLTKQSLLVLHLLVLLFSAPTMAMDKSVIIRLKNSPGSTEKVFMHQSKAVIHQTYQLIPALAASLPEKEIGQLRRHRNVDYIEEVAVYTAASDSEIIEVNEYPWGIYHISADIAHRKGIRGGGIKVAILDTGIDYTHEDLKDNYRGGYDFVFDDNDPFDDSYNSHGTHVAGIIAAKADPVGMVGVAPEVELYAVKVLDGAGFGTEEWIIAGLEWAVQNKIDIVNLSLEGPYRQGLQEACEKAYHAGVLVVAAGGNSMAYGGDVAYPAAFDSVIAVTAMDSNDSPELFSPMGEALELAAPGVGILSTMTGGGYGLVSGTSVAAPYVTGTAALYKSVNKEDLNNDGLVDHTDVRCLLQQTAIDLGDSGRDDIYGFGLVSALGSINCLDRTFILTRTTGPESLDATVVDIEGKPYGIIITNAGLDNVAVDVYEDEVLREDLSEIIELCNKRTQQEMICLDATDTHFSIQFTPYGTPGTSAEIVLTLDNQLLLQCNKEVP